MKKTLLVLLVSVFVSTAKAQTFDEWFKQKKTQKKYLLQQIAAIQMYAGYLQKGYAIARDGLKTISNIKNGEFNLHDAFFNSLQNINPNIRNLSKVAEMIQMQGKIFQTCKKSIKQLQKGNAFNNGEMSYIKSVYGKLLNDCTVTIDELIKVTTVAKLKMNDDERLKRIEDLYAEMKDKYVFANSFGNQAILLGLARSQEKNDVESSRKLTGVSSTP